MLSVIDVPPEIMELYKKSKLPAGILVQCISSRFPSQSVNNGTNICLLYPSSMIIIRNGIFKYSINNKCIRFYSTGDIISIPDKIPDNLTIINEFGAEVCIVSKNDFLNLIEQNEPLRHAWFNYQNTSDQVMHVLCSLFIKENYEPHSEIRQYQAGEVIIREGEKPDYLFELLEGKAIVTVRGTEIGRVNENEVFGEVSFLTGTERGATVTADTACMVQAIKRPDLEEFSKFRPGLIYKLSQTLAYRLNEVNRRLVSISSLT